MPPTSSDWLTLSGAAEMLGVHPGTVRHWSDRGVLPVHFTQGGHRRYLRSELELWSKSQHETADIAQVFQSALRTTRIQISEGRLNEELWYNKLDDDARQQYRASGRFMLQGIVKAISSHGEIDFSEAEALGYDYASRGRRCGLSSLEAIHAFLFFRKALVDSLFTVFESAAVRSPVAWGEMVRTINNFTDHILITLMETYEVLQRGER